LREQAVRISRHFISEFPVITSTNVVQGDKDAESGGDEEDGEGGIGSDDNEDEEYDDDDRSSSSSTYCSWFKRLALTVKF
jgi:hypothetical protein